MDQDVEELWEAICQANENKVRSLLQRGASLNSLSLFTLKKSTMTSSRERGSTALYTAASEGQVAIGHLLIQHGSNLDIPSEGGWTPLMVSVMREDIPFVSLLLSSGANPSILNKDGKTAFQLAQRKANSHLLSLFQQNQFAPMAPAPLNPTIPTTTDQNSFPQIPQNAVFDPYFQQQQQQQPPLLSHPSHNPNLPFPPSQPSLSPSFPSSSQPFSTPFPPAFPQSFSSSSFPEQTPLFPGPPYNPDPTQTNSITTNPSVIPFQHDSFSPQFGGHPNDDVMAAHLSPSIVTSASSSTFSSSPSLMTPAPTISVPTSFGSNLSQEENLSQQPPSFPSVESNIQQQQQNQQEEEQNQEEQNQQQQSPTKPTTTNTQESQQQESLKNSQKNAIIITLISCTLSFIFFSLYCYTNKQDPIRVIYRNPLLSTAIPLLLSFYPLIRKLSYIYSAHENFFRNLFRERMIVFLAVVLIFVVVLTFAFFSFNPFDFDDDGEQQQIEL